MKLIKFFHKNHGLLFFSKKGEIIEQISEIHRVRTDEHGVNMDGP